MFSVFLLAGGHLLIEDRPGIGNSTLAEALAKVFALAFKRVSLTRDLLQADPKGLNEFNPAEASFGFQPGPLFTQVLLADEINRASPRTQSSLPEVMAAGRVSVDGLCRPLPEIFVIAIPNRFDQVGTRPLPEALPDRFLMRLSFRPRSPLVKSLRLLARRGVEHLPGESFPQLCWRAAKMQLCLALVFQAMADQQQLLAHAPLTPSQRRHRSRQWQLRSRLANESS